MADAYGDLVALRGRGELAAWEPAGRPVRTGTWAEQAEPTLDRIAEALAAGRHDEAAALVRHLLVEAQEIHELYTEWVATLPRILEREGVTAQIEDVDTEAEWQRLRADVDELALRCASGEAAMHEVDALAGRWVAAHDRHLELVARWLDVVVERLGEERLGEVWAELQATGIASYARYDLAQNPWARSRALLVQIAIEGMHGHLGGPRTARRRRGPRARRSRGAALLAVRLRRRTPSARGVRRHRRPSRLRLERARRLPLLHPLLRPPAAHPDRPARLSGAGHRSAAPARRSMQLERVP